MSWPKEDLFAVTVDGKVLLNARCLDDADLAELARTKGVFVGVVLDKREVKELLERAYDASSEAAAFLVGTRRRRRSRRK
jgi:hypothetical protein